MFAPSMGVFVQNQAARVRRRAAKVPKSPPVILEIFPAPLKRAPVSLKLNKRWRRRQRRRAIWKKPSWLLLTGTAKAPVSETLTASFFFPGSVPAPDVCLFLSLSLVLTWLIRQLRVFERRQSGSQQQCDQCFAASIIASLHLFVTSAIFIIVLTTHLLASLPFYFSFTFPFK